MQPVIQYDPNRQPLYRASYVASTNGNIVTTTGANTTTSIAYLFHPNTNTKRIEIVQILISWAAPVGNNDISFRLCRITAENGTPGGTAQTINAFDQDDAVSTLTFRTSAAGAPTRATGDYFSVASVGGSSDIILFNAHQTGKPLILRASQSEGYEIRSVVGGANLASGFEVGVTFVWTEI